MGSAILLQGGTLLIPDDPQALSAGSFSTVKPVKADLLVVNDCIARIEPNLDIPADVAASCTVTTIDCSRKIITPGFIDTHHHLWQTQLRGRHGDHTVLDYMPTGNLAASFFKPADVFWGQLGGALEAIDSGTTTVVDHAHMNYSEKHSNHALAATLSSGVRSIFCYTPTPLVDSWTPNLRLAFPLVHPWHLEQIEQLAKVLAAHPRVSFGFGFDGYAFMPPDATQSLFARVRQAGAALITSHSFENPLLSGGKSLVESLAALGLLADDILLSHINGASKGDLALLAAHGAAVSCTPASEMHQGLGTPIAFLEPLEVPSKADVSASSAAVSAAAVGVEDKEPEANVNAAPTAADAERDAHANGTGNAEPNVPGTDAETGADSSSLSHDVDALKLGNNINGDHSNHVTAPAPAPAPTATTTTPSTTVHASIPQGLGCDSHSVVRGSMADQMRLALSLARMQRTQSLLDRAGFPRHLRPTVQQAFHLATAGGARAIRRQHDLGALQVGYKADIVVWDASAPGMVCAAAESPLTAVVCYAGTRDIEAVIVDGVLRKREGRLVDFALQGSREGLISDDELAALGLRKDGVAIDVNGTDTATADGTAPADRTIPAADTATTAPADGPLGLGWTKVADALERSRLEIHNRMTGPLTRNANGDLEDAASGADTARDAMIAAFGLDASVLA